LKNFLIGFLVGPEINFTRNIKFGDLALVIFVAIPLPLTGGWTGAVAAFLFGIPYFKSLGLIFLGIFLAGIIITLTSTGFFSLIRVI